MVEVKIVALPPVLAACKREKGAYKEAIPRLLKELFEAVQNNCAGAPLFVCRDEEPKETGDVECAVPINEKQEFGNGVFVRELPGGKFVQALCEGPYGGCGPTYQALFAFAKENGLQLAGPTRETYLNDPATTPESKLETLIQFPVK